MRVVTITEAKNGLSALLDLVQSGESILIVDRGRPVARLESAVSTSLIDPDGRLARLERAGVVQVAPSSSVRTGTAAPPRARAGTSAVEALIEERRGGR